MTLDDFLNDFLKSCVLHCVEGASGEWPDIPVAPGPAYEPLPFTPRPVPTTPADCACTLPPDSLAWCQCEARATLEEIDHDLGRDWLVTAVLEICRTPRRR